MDHAGWQIKMREEAASLAEASKKLDASAESLKERLNIDVAFYLPAVGSTAGRSLETIP